MSAGEGMPVYVTPAQASGIVHLPVWPLVQACRSGELRAFRPVNTGPWLIRPEDLERWVERPAEVA